MNVAIRYYSKTGHMAKMADVVSGVTGVKAETIDVPVNEPVDILFLGSAIYVAGIDSKVKEFIAQLDPEKVKCVVCFSSAAILSSSYSQVKSLLQRRGIKVSEKEFHCRGQYKILHRGHPNADDLEDLKTFVEGIV